MAFYVPSRSLTDWRNLLADPANQWATGYSARTLAHSWADAAGFPCEVHRILAKQPALAKAEPLLIFPEWKVPLPGGKAASQSDLWVLAKRDAELISMTVEGKVNEPFGETLGEWLSKKSSGRRVRLAFLVETLGLTKSLSHAIRYQLLHRTASAVIEAERFAARHAVMLVHSFSSKNLWFNDFAAFCELLDLAARPNEIVSTATPAGIQLHLGWVSGDEWYLGPCSCCPA